MYIYIRIHIRVVSVHIGALWWCLIARSGTLLYTATSRAYSITTLTTFHPAINAALNCMLPNDMRNPVRIGAAIIVN